APRLGAYLLWSAGPDGVFGSEDDVKRVGGDQPLSVIPTGSQHQFTGDQRDSAMSAVAFMEYTGSGSVLNAGNYDYSRDTGNLVLTARTSRPSVDRNPRPAPGNAISIEEF